MPSGAAPPEHGTNTFPLKQDQEGIAQRPRCDWDGFSCVRASEGFSQDEVSCGHCAPPRCGCHEPELFAAPQLHSVGVWTQSGREAVLTAPGQHGWKLWEGFVLSAVCACCDPSQ